MTVTRRRSARKRCLIFLTNMIRGGEKIRLMLDQMHDDLYSENPGEDDEKSSLAGHKTKEELSTEEAPPKLLRRHNFETHNQPQSNHTNVTATEWTDVFPHFQVVGKSQQRQFYCC